MHEYSFEKLDVWKFSIKFVKDIYKVTRKFPSEEKFGLVSQINRAAVSVPSNIAEGSSRNSSKEKSHFTSIAYGSMMELITQLTISKEIGYIKYDVYNVLREQAEVITNKLNALRNYQRKA